MGKKLTAFFLSFLIILSLLPINAGATAAADEINPNNPFAMQDGARGKSVQLSKMAGHPQKSNGEKKNPKRYSEEKKNPKNPRTDSTNVYNVKFSDSSSLNDIYNCVSKYTYQLLGDSSSRLFKMTIKNLKSFKSKYSKIIEDVTSDTEIKVYDEPNDIYYPAQWPLADIKMPQAWNITKGSSNVKVAVIDTGFDRTHEDFTNTQILNGCDITDNNAPVIEDAVGHGTEVISVIAAETNNAKGISGAGWNVCVVPYKVADEYGDIYGSSVISAITMAADAGCNVISMSLGSYSYDGAMKSAIDYANSKGCIVVAAAGNEGTTGNSYAGSQSYPASYNGVVSVASVGRSNGISSFSQYNTMVDVAAPGENILVAQPFSLRGYTVSSGTSFSTPYVASVAALAKSMNQGLSGNDFQRLIEVSSTDLGTPHRDDYYGWGLLNAGALLNAEKCPLVYGVNDNCIYNASKVITFNKGTATLNGRAFTSGSTVSADGIYVLAVTDTSGNCTAMHFTIDKTTPVVSGVANGKSYNTDQIITFNEGTATLNAQPCINGAAVSDEGSYTLIVTDSAANSKTITFTIDKTPPVISGAEDGATYHSSVILSFNEGNATLNGKSFATNSTVSAAGSYTLAVADVAGNSSTISFTLSDLPTIQSVALPSALSKWAVDGSTGELCALSDSNLLFINPDTLQIDATMALPAAPTDLIAHGGKLYIALDSVSQIQVVDIASRTAVKTLTTAKDPYRIVKDEESLFYTQRSQWSGMRKYNLSTDADSDIGGSFYQPAIAVNPSLHILYIGESGLSGSVLSYYDENLQTFTKCSYDGGYGFSYPSRNICFDGTSVYYAGRRFAPDNPNRYSASFFGSKGVLAVINGCIITGNGTVFDRNTYLQIGTFSNTVSLADVAGSCLLYYNSSTKTISRATCSGSIGTDTIVGLLAGTYTPPAPKPGSVIQINANTQKTMINSSLSGWVPDEDGAMLYAISASGKALYFIKAVFVKIVDK